MSSSRVRICCCYFVEDGRCKISKHILKQYASLQLDSKDLGKRKMKCWPGDVVGHEDLLLDLAARYVVPCVHSGWGVFFLFFPARCSLFYLFFFISLSFFSEQRRSSRTTPSRKYWFFPLDTLIISFVK